MSEIVVNVTDPGSYAVSVDGATPTTATVSNGGSVSVTVAGAEVQWNDLVGVPTEFTPEAHDHVMADITDLAFPVTSVNGQTGAVTIETGGGGGASLSDDIPQPLGIADAGTSETAARADHIHGLPTAAEVGALDQNSVVDGGDYVGVIVQPETPVITITTQPTDATAAGGAATFYVAAIHSAGAAISYQWQKSNDAGTTWANVSGGTSATLSLSGLTNADDDGDLYRCNLSATGTDGVTTDEATLTVPAGLVSSGPMFGWGVSTYGAIGDGTLSARSQPTAIGTVSSWSTVSTCNHHSLAIRSDGKLFSWGLNNYGQVGDGGTNNRLSPVQIGTSNWVAVSAGFSHSFAIREDGALFAWGRGPLGDGTTSNSLTPVQIGQDSWLAVSAGQNRIFAVAIRSDGKLFAWGDNISGQLGDGTTTQRTSPTQVGTDGWLDVSAGGQHWIGVRSDGKLFACGYNSNGQLGDGTTDNKTTPVQIGTSDWQSVSAGLFHSCAISSTAGLFAWGQNDLGQLGDYSNTDSLTPVSVQSAVSFVSAGQRFTLAIKTTGKLVAAGYNGQYQLGNGSAVDQNYFAQVGQANWLAVSAGATSALGITQ